MMVTGEHRGGGRGVGGHALRAMAAKKFRAHGLMLKSRAVQLLEEALMQLAEDAPEDVERTLDHIVLQVSANPSGTSAVSPDDIYAVLEKMRGDAPEDEMQQEIDGPIFEVIDAFSVPKFLFNPDRKTFYQTDRKRNLHATATAKAKMFRDRFQILLQRTTRNKLFTTPLPGLTPKFEHFHITPLDALLGSRSNQAQGSEDAPVMVVMGVLVQLQEGRYSLEDLHGNVQLNLSKATYCSGLFTENQAVVVEGQYFEGIFHATTVGFPPPETRAVTIQRFPKNFFGGQAPQLDREQLYHLETATPGMFIVLSDVWLDKPQVMAKLRELFDGYSQLENPPAAFVFMGNFTSEPYGVDHVRTLRGSMDAFADLISEYPSLKESHFVFVPGPQDPGSGKILPRPPIPSVCTGRMLRKVPNAIFTSNPARIRYLSQEMVFFREDIVNKMRRNCIRPPTVEDEETDISSHLVKTLIDQAHLAPLPLHVQPVYWEYDHALQLYPVPDVLVLADKFDPYNLTYEECTTFNPGSFLVTNFSFMVYWPSKLRVDPTQSEEARAEYDSRVEFSRID